MIGIIVAGHGNFPTGIVKLVYNQVIVNRLLKAR